MFERSEFEICCGFITFFRDISKVGFFFLSFGLRVIYHHHHHIHKSANVMIFIHAKIVSCKKEKEEENSPKPLIFRV